ncbi:uncharacterized protein ARMOST_07540 [Armillaria ostoyae]|uniref:Integrase catalytic domain-containing protein n=1 Tax=Armillaria ostoyae TaxID=47428 RepID=A0A284R655_ARMOS|nr:uncharacterized protein ARMOST_07540 [Armillaria ostoyae]
MLALNEWRHYLMGAAVDFEIWTDHQNLQYFCKPQKLNRQQPGAANKKADLLSRRADHPQGQDDNDEIIVLTPEHFQAMIMPTTDETHERIKTGHPGIEKTKELILCNYWWLKLKRDVEAYVQGCKTCARTKASTQARRAPLHPNEIPSKPWTHISVDMVTGLVPCKGNDAILVIVNRFSKAIIPVACKTTLSSEGWAKILRDEVYAKYGMPTTVISNHRPQSVSKFLEDLYKMLQIKGNTSTAFHPQTDGQTEHVNQEIEKYLRIFINHQQTDWPEWLPLAVFQHNNRIYSTTGKSPFFVNYGRNPRVAPDSHSHTPLGTPSSMEFKATMKLIHDETKVALTKAAEQMKTQYDKKKKAAVEYQTRDKVWLNTTNLHLARPKKKLDDKHVGPFTVIEKRGLFAYKLKLPPTWKIYPVFNETLLTPYTPPIFPNQVRDPPPPPDIINDEEEYEVESILDHKTCKVHGPKNPKTGKYTMNTVTDYLVKWKGYGPEEHKWTVERELQHAKEVIAEYLAKRKDTITVQAIMVDQKRNIVISDAIKADDTWRYLVKRPLNISYWEFEDKIPELKDLIDDYWYINDQERPNGEDDCWNGRGS